MLYSTLVVFPAFFQEWFLERYHPKTEESKKYTKLEWVDQESAVFGKQLRANPRQFIASASLDPISEVNPIFRYNLLWMTARRAVVYVFFLTIYSGLSVRGAFVDRQ